MSRTVSGAPSAYTLRTTDSEWGSEVCLRPP